MLVNFIFGERCHVLLVLIQVSSRAYGKSFCWGSFPQENCDFCAFFYLPGRRLLLVAERCKASCILQVNCCKGLFYLSVVLNCAHPNVIMFMAALVDIVRQLHTDFCLSCHCQFWISLGPIHESSFRAPCYPQAAV